MTEGRGTRMRHGGAYDEDGRLFRKLVVENADAVVLVSTQGAMLFANPAAEALFGRPIDRLRGAPFGFPLTAGESAEIDIVRPDGRRAVAEMRTTRLEWERQEVFLASLRDTTQRRMAEERLRRFERILNCSPDLIALFDADLICCEANEAFGQAFRRATAPAVGRTAAEIFGADDFAAHLVAGLRRALAGQESHHQGGISLHGGDRRFYHAAFSPYLDADRSISAAIVTLRDITETKALETQLQQSRKMEAIGTLAGGVAHDFNNLLMGIQGHVGLLQLKTDRMDPAVESLQSIQALVQRAADLTRQLLGFARGGQYHPLPTDLNALLGETLELFGRTHRQIVVETRWQEDLWPVEVDRTQIGQVFLNLFVNAWQAMPEGGTLTAETANTVVGEEQAAAHGISPGRYVEVRVRDTGEGIEPSVIERIFDPFFTTKPKGQGIGMGLASAYGIVRSHRGSIKAASRKGAGATFFVLLPACERPAVDAPHEVGAPIGGRERLLLVDDEPMVRDVEKRLLESLGYEVTAAASGPEALAIAERRRGAIDLVILDMIMPGMSGRETFERLKAMDPGLKVLLSSGYSRDGQAAAIMAAGCHGFIQKPFSLEEISRTIRGILDAAPPPDEAAPPRAQGF